MKDEISLIYDATSCSEPGVKIRGRTSRTSRTHCCRRSTAMRLGAERSVQWSLFEQWTGEMQGSTMYLGTDGRCRDRARSCSCIGHVHAGFTNNNAIVIWWNPRSRRDATDGFAIN